MGISIVIPAYNEEKCLPETMSYLEEARRRFFAKFALPTEIIVVNNDSTDKTAEVAAQLGALVVHHTVRNIASVRNAGIRAANFDLVVTVDADNFIPPHAFTEIWSAMQNEKYIGGGVRLRLRSQKAHLRWFVVVFEQTMVAVTGLSGGMFFFRRQAALEIGGFPEELLVAEDMTFAHNLRALGRKTGRKFLNLRTVTLLTFDRKEISFYQSLKAIGHGVRAFMGAKVRREDLGFWYKPKR